MIFGWNVQDYQKYRANLSKILNDDEGIRELYRVHDLVDVKASALLTHVSIMIAACAFFYDQFKDNDLIGSLLLVEGVIYIISSLMLVFCVNVYKITDSNNAAAVSYQSAKASLFRINVYKMAHILTIVATVLLIGTITAKIL